MQKRNKQIFLLGYRLEAAYNIAMTTGHQFDDKVLKEPTITFGNTHMHTSYKQ
jgi:hypothetical protein